MSKRHDDDDDLAYGDYYGHDSREGDQGFMGDLGKHFFGSRNHSNQASNGGKTGGMSFFDKLHNQIQDPLHNLVSDIKNKVSGENKSPVGNVQAQGQAASQPGQESHPGHRFMSFAPERHGNNAKWYVDGCSYMYAVSMAIERARESIWILDWWLSPELYLRRPPAKNQQYRLDRMLQAAAERGVKVSIIVYKEVTQALTRKLLNPTLPDYLHSLLPNTTDAVTKHLTRAGLEVVFKSLEAWEESNPLIAPPITVSSAHTKHALEALHPNISVFRHPDHLPDAAVLQGSFISSFQNMSFSAANLAKLPGDAVKAIYGAHDGTVMYWAHHEKLCLIDGETAFMGGLDLCYGRWDTNQHSIADAHPGNLDRIVFPGQDYNNARILDFQDPANWEANKLDRTVSSRMGWSDVALCLAGPAVHDLRTHFAQRWNFIFKEKYSKKATRYAAVSDTGSGIQQGNGQQRARFGQGEQGFGHKMFNKVNQEFHDFEHQIGHDGRLSQQTQSQAEQSFRGGNIDCQITRSSAKWSHNIATEHSIQNAYCETIRNSQHFVYIENQFFITATGDSQRPIRNKIGEAIVERIVRAGRNGEKYKMIICIPAVPAFAGDLKVDEALGTRAIMEFQYDSINRGGHSIYEEIARAGLNPLDYIRFYNLRSYDRINVSKVMQDAEHGSGISYGQASEGFDAVHDAPQQPNFGDDSTAAAGYNRYQQEASKIGGREGLGDGRWDTVAECYMLNGEDIRNVPWQGGAMDEIDAFVSEELYIHSKLLIADDQTVICGSANLNDRSQLGDHDSEIAIIIRDVETVDSQMNRQPWQASKFAASLRRQIFRKHLGLLRPQNMEQQDASFEPVGSPNLYDWGSEEDQVVVDPISEEFQNTWNWRASTNTKAFAKVFHPVPSDEVKNWREYDSYYEHFFGVDAKEKNKKKPSLYKVGHVVAQNFSQGEAGIREVKDVLATIKGNLVEMPLLFLREEDIAKDGVTLNQFTEELYT